MLKKVYLMLMMSMIVGLSGCTSSHVTEAGDVGVIIDNPMFFGHGGVRDVVQVPGRSWYWTTTDVIDYPIYNVNIPEQLDHLPTSDNNFINYNSYLILEYKADDMPYNVKTFGKDRNSWYRNNIQEMYRTFVRDVTKNYSMTEIMTNSEKLNEIQNKVLDKTRDLIKKTGLKVTLKSVNMGRALPNEAVVQEMDNTAVQQQRQKTETQKKLAEDARKEAESSRAKADNAYREEMKLNTEQFVALESIKRYSEACKTSKNCVIVQGGSSVMVNSHN